VRDEPGPRRELSRDDEVHCRGRVGRPANREHPAEELRQLTGGESMRNRAATQPGVEELHAIHHPVLERRQPRDPRGDVHILGMPRAQRRIGWLCMPSVHNRGIAPPRRRVPSLCTTGRHRPTVARPPRRRKRMRAFGAELVRRGLL
jgi:hypothetical protein